MHAIVLAVVLIAAPGEGPQWKAGVARVKITPAAPVWMSGYASRNHASEGVLHDLWAKALVLESGPSQRVVILTADLIALPREICDELAEHARKKHGLERSQLLCNAAHTHSGPLVWPNLKIFDLDEEGRKRAVEYAEELKRKLTGLIDAALADLSPAQVHFASGTCGFAMNRRESTDKGVKLGVNRQGPVDHTVPVLRIAAPDGKLRAVLFGYACHNTTLGGDFYKLCGDYAGFAQIAVEKANPGATAMFMILCGADQNPQPRGTVELAEKHGEALAAAVGRVLHPEHSSPKPQESGDESPHSKEGELRPVRPPVRTAYEVVQLDFPPHERAAWEEEAKNKDRFRQRRAQLMLEAHDRGQPVRSVACPVQAVRFGDDLTLVAIGGEVVVDYALRLKREFPKENLIVAGYSNDVPCYIPSLRVLREGGYETEFSMIYYGLPGPFAENVEEKVIAGCRAAIKRVREQ